MATVYDLDDATSEQGAKRLMQIAVTDLLGLDNNLNRVRTILYAVQTGIKVRETGDLADRLAAVEGVLGRQGHGPDPFASADDQQDELGV